ncbi:unnamed protein product [Protopolystoma xenopodis]|uniref:Uncharacterized protein n=1 Tax=Protopolystoma xenopodis TaxID=117903 RepID=A0A3S5B808_9PLAT|nr:unnamed protein product [Protopolystoma xenopodis]
MCDFLQVVAASTDHILTLDDHHQEIVNTTVFLSIRHNCLFGGPQFVLPVCLFILTIGVATIQTFSSGHRHNTRPELPSEYPPNHLPIRLAGSSLTEAMPYFCIPVHLATSMHYHAAELVLLPDEALATGVPAIRLSSHLLVRPARLHPESRSAGAVPLTEICPLDPLPLRVPSNMAELAIRIRSRSSKGVLIMMAARVRATDNRAVGVFSQFCTNHN